MSESSAPRYVLGELIGEGGMGEVARCRDTKLGRDVAMKLLRASIARTGEPRFLKEVRVQAQLEHPGIVPVYDVGRDETGRAFFTMRRVQGSALDGIIARLVTGDEKTKQTFTRHRLLAAFLRVCLAIEFAHTHGVLHRDLKPGNVMLGDFGEVYVLDWGVAKHRPDSDSAEKPIVIHQASSGMVPIDAMQTETGLAVGTLMYMAPEQALGLAVDERTDVFSLGAILFEILTYEPLLSPEVVTRRLYDSVTVDARPSTRGAKRRGHAPIPVELDAICVKATAKNKADRYQSARELHEAVERFLATDRDLSTRARLAQTQIETAEAAVEQAFGDDEEASRVKAIRAVGQAIALAPSNPIPLALLERLLAQPMRSTPQEVADRLDAERIARQGRVMPITAVIFAVPWLTVYPLYVLLAEARHWTWFIAPLAWGLTALAFWVAYRRRFYSPRAPIFTIIVAIAIALTSSVAGPTLLGPVLAVVVSMGYTLVAKPSRRWTIVAIMSGSIVIPSFLSRIGVLDQLVYNGDSVTFHGAIILSSTLFQIALASSHLTAILLAVFLGYSFRKSLDDVEERSLLDRWLRRQIVAASLEPASLRGGADAPETEQTADG